MRFNRQIQILCVLTIPLLFGCSEKQTTQPVPATTLAPVDAGGQASISKEEAMQFANEWQTAVTNGDAAGAQLVMFDKIVDRALASFTLEQKQLDGARAGLKKSQPIANMIRQLGTACSQGGNYLLVRTAVRAGEQHAIFRLIDAAGSLNYHDFRVVRDGGKIRADQLFIAATGEEFSDTLRTAMAPAVASQQSMLGRIDGSAKKSTDELKLQKELLDAARAGNLAKADEIYEKLSPETQATKIVQLGRIMAIGADNEKRHLEAIDEYSRSFPNDPSLALMTLDAAMLREDVGQLNKCYDSIQSWTGGDDYINLMIGSVLGKLGETARAAEIYSKVNRDALVLADMHDFALGLTLAIKDNSAVLYHLRTMRDDFGYEFSDLTAAEGFEDFVMAEEFKQWQND